MGPVIVHISKVHLRLAFRREWHREDCLKRRAHVKQRDILAAEFRRVSSSATTSGKLFWQFGIRMWNALLQRIRLKIDAIHIDFEDRRAPHVPLYRFGIDIASIQTTEGTEMAKGQPRDPIPENEILKSLSVQGLTLFWTPDAEKTDVEMCSLLSPTSVQVYLYLQSLPTSDREGEVHIAVERLDGSLNEGQLVSIASFLDDLSVWQKRSLYVHHRPEKWKTAFERKVLGIGAVQKMDSASAWRYAICSVLQV